MSIPRTVRVGTVGALGLVLGTAALSWGFTPSGMGGAVGQFEGWLILLASLFMGVFMPFAALCATIWIAWVFMFGRGVTKVGGVIAGMVILGGGLGMWSEYFGTAQGALLVPPVVTGAHEAGGTHE